MSSGLQIVTDMTPATSPEIKSLSLYFYLMSKLVKLLTKFCIGKFLNYYKLL